MQETQYVEIRIKPAGYLGYLSAERLLCLLDTPDELLGGAIFSNMQRSLPTADLAAEFVLHTDEALGVAHFKGQVRETLEPIVNPPARTPITQETLLAWAEERVRTEPVIHDHVWNEETGSMEAVAFPNTPAREIASLLHNYIAAGYDENGVSDLREDIRDLLWSGHKGYKNYGLDEALAEALELFDFEKNDSLNYRDVRDLESLLEQFAW